MTTSVASTVTSLPAPTARCESFLPASAEGAALRSLTLTELGCSPESVAALTCLLLALLGETLSGDAFALAVYRGEKMALDAGVSAEEWKRVGRIVMAHWLKERNKNPLSGMF